LSIEKQIDIKLWDAVHKPYQQNDFTSVILDAIQYLGDTIREKSGLNSDGVNLVGEAFGGGKPKIRVNRFETESEKNVQNGIEHLIRGIYKAFRNPRSHEKHIDSREDAETVLSLISYLLQIIGKSKSPFDREAFINRVFDEEFVATDRYAELLAKEIPSKSRFDVLLDVYRDRRKGEPEKLVYIVRAIWKLLSEDSQNEFAAIVSGDLNAVQRSGLSKMIKLLPAEVWPKCGEAARIRCETILLSSIKEGRLKTGDEQCDAGALGTWATNLMPNWLLKSELDDAIANVFIGGNPEAINYIFEYIFNDFIRVINEPSPWLTHILRGKLSQGNSQFYDALAFISVKNFDDETFEETETYMYPGWHAQLSSAMEHFVVNS
jgi:uncharacterized protein (TIGR02391 family)